LRSLRRGFDVPVYFGEDRKASSRVTCGGCQSFSFLDTGATGGVGGTTWVHRNASSNQECLHGVHLSHAVNQTGIKAGGFQPNGCP
jgi:hypothetical protein